MTSVAQQVAVKQVIDGSKAYFRIDPSLLRGDLDTLFAASASAKQQLEGLSWAAVLGNGTNPGVDVDFYGYEALGLGAVTTSGTFEGDSLVLNKDAEIAGRLEVVGVATIGDSLWVEGAVVLSDSLRVVKAVAVGSRLHVSGVSAFGDSVHVVGNVDLDALFHVDGAATFGSEVDIAGKLSAHDSVSFASALEVMGVTSFGDSLIIEGGTAMRAGANVSGVLVADSIASGKVLNAQIRDLANHDTDGLTEGATNLYFTDSRAQGAFTSGTGVTLNSGEISIGQSVGTTDNVSFAGIAATATVTADSLSVTDVINGRVSSLANHDTDGLTEGATNLYFTDSRAQGAFTSGTGVTLNSGEIAIGQSVGTTDNVSFAGIAATATVTADSLSVTDVINGRVSSLANHDTDGLTEGATNLYFTDSRAQGAFTSGTGVTLNSGEISIGQSVGTTDNVEFAGIEATGTVSAESLVVTNVISGEVSSLGNHDTDGLTEGFTNLYYTDARARSAFSSGMGVTMIEGQISIGQDVSTTSDVTFDELTANSLQSSGPLTVSGVTTLNDSLVSGVSGFVMRSASDFSLQALDGDFEILGEKDSGDSPAIRMLFADSNYFNHASENNKSFLEIDGWWDMKLHVDDDAGIEMYYGNSGEKSELFFYGDSMVFEQGDVYIANDLTLTGLEASATVTADSLSVTDVINGQVSSLANHSTDDLAEGSTNLYLTPAERASLVALEAMAHAIDSLSCTWLKHQGYVYELILIGNQCWFAENLRSENYANGEAILAGFTDQQWFITSFGSTAVFGDDENNVEAYGRLYNHYAVADARGLCPNGWHVPTSSEWTTLANYLAPGEGNALKSSGSDVPAWDGSNSSGFSALPGGMRGMTGAYSDLGTKGFWWTSSLGDWDDPVMRLLVSGDSAIDGYSMPSKFGFSVRCLRD